jgi:nicotinate-nucleotide pyrophosphorylase (carboxylating)
MRVLTVTPTARPIRKQAVAAGADVVMLDNFEPVALHDVAKTLKAESPHVLLEASGGA